MIYSKRHYPMKSDVREKDDMYILDIDLPGFQREDIKACVKDGYLIVSASRTEDQEHKKGHMIRQERYSGEYRRSFYVGSMLQQEDIKASYKHGVLKLEFPKQSKRKALSDDSIHIA
mgnify:CR=1 FL=1